MTNIHDETMCREIEGARTVFKPEAGGLQITPDKLLAQKAKGIRRVTVYDVSGKLVRTFSGNLSVHPFCRHFLQLVISFKP